MEQGITPLRMVVGFMMSGEEPPLEVYHTEDNTQNKKVLRLIKDFDKVSFLFNFNVPIHEARHPIYKKGYLGGQE